MIIRAQRTRIEDPATRDLLMILGSNALERARKRKSKRIAVRIIENLIQIFPELHNTREQLLVGFRYLKQSLRERWITALVAFGSVIVFNLLRAISELSASFP